MNGSIKFGEELHTSSEQVAAKMRELATNIDDMSKTVEAADKSFQASAELLEAMRRSNDPGINAASQYLQAQAAQSKRQALERQADDLYRQGMLGEMGSPESQASLQELKQLFTPSELETKFRTLADTLAGSVATGFMNGLKNGRLTIEEIGAELEKNLMKAATAALTEGISAGLKGATNSLMNALFSQSGTGSENALGMLSSSFGGISDAFSSWFGGGLSLSACGNAFTGGGMVRAFASGGAFGNGGVLTNPAFFRFADGGQWRTGVAGEAGTAHRATAYLSAQR